MVTLANQGMVSILLLVIAAGCWAAGAVLLGSLPIARRWWGTLLRHAPVSHVPGTVLSALGGLCLGAAAILSLRQLDRAVLTPTEWAVSAAFLVFAGVLALVSAQEPARSRHAARGSSSSAVEDSTLAGPWKAPAEIPSGSASSTPPASKAA